MRELRQPVYKCDVHVTHVAVLRVFGSGATENRVGEPVTSVAGCGLLSRLSNSLPRSHSASSPLRLSHSWNPQSHILQSTLTHHADLLRHRCQWLHRRTQYATICALPSFFRPYRDTRATFRSTSPCHATARAFTRHPSRNKKLGCLYAPDSLSA